MTVAQVKASRRRAITRFGKAPSQKKQGRSVGEAIEAERKKAARAARIKR